MSDISVIRPQMPVSTHVAKPMPTADQPMQGAKEAKGNNLPQASDVKNAEATDEAANVQVSEQKAKEKADSDELKVAVKTANDFVQTVQRDLHFSIDDDTDRTVVKVVESSSGEVIRQIPDETFLELARKMKEHGQVNLVDATG